MEKSKEHIVHVGCDRGLCHQAVGRQDKQLNTYDWLADVPGNPYTTDLVEVQFKHTRKGYYHNVNNLDLKKGDIVAVEASPGHDIGVVTLTGRLVKLQLKKVNIKSPDDIKRIYRIARENDIQKWREAQAREHSTMIESRKIAKGLGLDMKIGDVEYQGDGNKAIFYYIADERVDFRQLIKDLAQAFHVRIEMKQIGARQEAGRIGGTGPCGRELCCATWMKNFSSVSTNAARFQDISLNPQKLAGMCAKLKCCLNYEVDDYVEAGKQLPGKDIALKKVVVAILCLQHQILWRQLLASLYVIIYLVVETALQLGTHTCQLLWVERDVLETGGIGAYTREVLHPGGTAQLTSARAGSTNTSSLLARTNLLHLDTYVEGYCQVLDELTEIHTLVGDIIEDCLVAIALIFYVANLHVET